MGEVFDLDGLAELGVDGGDELGVRLICGKAAHQPGNKSLLACMVGQGQQKQYLGLCGSGGKACLLHGVLNGDPLRIEGFQLRPLLCGHLLVDQIHKLAVVEFQIISEQRSDRKDRDHENEQHHQKYGSGGLSSLFIRKQGCRRFRKDCSCTHHFPPAVPNAAIL